MTDGSESAPMGAAADGVDMRAPVAIPPVFDGESEEALALRFGRIIKEQPDLVFEFTRDPALLHQYYEIRETEFKAIYGAPGFNGAETEHDRKGHILVVRRGNHCVGGVRLTYKTPRQPQPLPMEIKGFEVENYFPELKNKEARYAQASWFVLLPEFRGGDITRKMMERVCKKAAAANMKMLFGVAPILNARMYVKHFKVLGLQDSKVHTNIELPSYPTYEEIKLYLISTMLDPAVLNVTSDGVVMRATVAIPPVFDGESEEALALRFGRRVKEQPKLEFEFTRDKGLLEQYYRIRERMYASVLGLQHFSGMEDECDKRSHVLVAREGDQVIGGARITVKSPRQPKPLSLEDEDFLLERELPQMRLKEKKYGEFSRLALLPEHHGGKVAGQIYQHLNRKSIALGLQYVFAVSTPLQAKRYRRTYVAQGFDYTILENITVPEKDVYEGIAMCLSCLDLTSFAATEGYGVDSEMYEEA